MLRIHNILGSIALAALIVSVIEWSGLGIVLSAIALLLLYMVFEA